MKRFLASALIIGASSFGMVGCEGEKAAEKVETTVTTPEGGKTTETTEHTVKTDEKAPAPAETAPAPAPTPAVTPEAPK